MFFLISSILYSLFNNKISCFFEVVKKKKNHCLMGEWMDVSVTEWMPRGAIYSLKEEVKI